MSIAIRLPSIIASSLRGEGGREPFVQGFNPIVRQPARPLPGAFQERLNYVGTRRKG
jgi:hypothetical protein